MAKIIKKPLKIYIGIPTIYNKKGKRKLIARWLGLGLNNKYRYK